MLMVIFGAGASYDAFPMSLSGGQVPTGYYRLPLAMELFPTDENF